MIVNKKTQNIIGNIKYFIVHLLLKYFLFFFSIIYSKYMIKVIKYQLGFNYSYRSDLK